MKKAQGVFTIFLWVATLLLTSCTPKLGIRQIPPEGVQLRKGLSGEKCNVPSQNAKIGATVSFLEDVGSVNMTTWLTLVEVEEKGDCGDGALYVEPEVVRGWKEGPYPTPAPYDPWAPLPSATP